MELFKLLGTIAIENADANAAIDDTDHKASKVHETFKKGMGTIAKWSAVLGAAAIAAATGLVKVAGNSAATADNIDKMSQKIGISREAYQELDFICSQSGMSVDTLQAGMKTLVSVMDTTAAGTSQTATAFEELGIRVTNSDGSLRDSEEVMWETLSAMQSMENQTQKARYAAELFGRSGTELMPLLNGAAGSIEAMKDQAHDLGIVLDDDTIDAGVEMTDTVDQMKRSLGAVVTNIGGELMPIVTKLSNYIIKQMPKIRQLFQKLSPVITKMLESIEPMLESFANKFLPVIFKAMSKLLPVLSNVAQKLLPVVADVMGTIVDLFADFLPVVANIAEKVLPVFATIFETLMGLFSSFTPIIKNIVDVILPPLEFILGGISTAIGWVCNGISGLLGVLGLRHESLTQEQEDSIVRCEAAKEEAEKYRETKEAVQEARDAAYDKAAADMEATAKVEDLWNELQTLCDESGNVKEADKERADFILNELNGALGTEYELTGNQIKNYQEMQAEIDKIIEKKKAEILLTAAEENYRNAIQGQAEAQAEMVNALKAVEEQQQRVNGYKQEQQDLDNEWLELQYKAQDANQTLTIGEQDRMNQIELRQAELEKVIDKEEEALEQRNDAYSQAAAIVQGYNNDIAKYETASGLMLADKTAEAIELLDKRGEVYLKASQIHGEATAAQMNQLRQQVIDAGVQYEILKQQMDGCAEYEKAYYEEELKKAQEHFDDMQNEYTTAGGKVTKSFVDEIDKTVSAYYGSGGSATYHGTKLIEGVADGVEASEPKIKRTVSGAVRRSFEGAEKENENTAHSLGKNLAAGVITGIDIEKEHLASSGSRLIDYVSRGAKKRAEIHSPSRLFEREIGEQLPAGVGVGIENNEEAAIRPMYDLISDMTLSSYDTVGQVPSAYGGAVPTVMSGAVSSAMPSNNDIIAKLNELIAVLRGQKIYLDSGALVGGMAADMNEALGVLAVGAERGR